MKLVLPVVYLALALNAQAQTNSFDPESAYSPRQIEGWHVLVNQKLLAETNLCDRVVKVLSMHLFQITRVVPAPALAKIRQIPIWVELDNATNFLSWSLEQPCMVLHELAHGYHHRFLGDDYAAIHRCYEHARAA